MFDGLETIDLPFHLAIAPIIDQSSLHYIIILAQTLGKVFQFINAAVIHLVQPFIQ